MCALEENAHTAGYPNRNPKLLFKLRCKKTRETLFLLKSALVAFLSPWFKWGKQKSN